MSSINSQNRRWFVQSHGVRRLRFGVLLAVQEGDYGLALSQSVRLHVLGHEALVSQKETSLAAWNASRSSGYDCIGRWYRCARYDHW